MRAPAASLELDQPAADPGRVVRDLGERDVPGGVAPLGVRALGQQPAQHLVGGPLDGGDRRDAEPLVDLGPPGVVDPGDDVLDAEGLAGDPGGDDVGVVAAADGGEAPARSMPASTRVSRSKPTPATCLPAKVGPSRRNACLVLVDDRDRVAEVLEAVREARADPAAAHDHDVHSGPFAGGTRWRPRTLHGWRDRGVLRGRCRSPSHAGGRSVGRTRPYDACVLHQHLSKRVFVGRPLAAPSSARRCCPSASRCRCSPATRCRPWPTPPRRSSSCSPSAGWPSSTTPGTAAAVVVLMAWSSSSYRQNVHAYPSGGGDYEVATTNLGSSAGDASRRAARWTTSSPSRCPSLGCREHHLRRALAARSTGPSSRSARRCVITAAQPARRAGVRRGLRDPDLRLHRRVAARDRVAAFKLGAGHHLTG